jgi:imidazole glycerol-phosphate synthase subunit HisF
MLKKRLIFTLLFTKSYFMLSRNFRLQKVGDLNWLNKNYNFKNIAFSIDELVMLDVSKNEGTSNDFCEHIKSICDQCFVPIAAGGGIRQMADAKQLLDSGADKIIVNTSLYETPDLVQELVQIYGSQCVIASIDYKAHNGDFEIYINNGITKIDIELGDYLQQVIELGIGEIYLNSIDKDGTGQGYNSDIISQLPSGMSVPLIMAGGAGNSHHLLNGINNAKVDAVATANLFNFIGNGLPSARASLIENKIQLAQWDESDDKNLYHIF